MPEDSGSEPVLPVGFVGLGNIGAPMAERLLEWPGGLVVYDVSVDALGRFEDAGAGVASGVGELAATCGLVCVMVNTEQQVRDVLAGLVDGVAGREPDAPTLVVAVHSTISPGGAEEMAASAASAGVALLDVPVSGGAMGAAQGSLALMVGGDPEAFESARGALGLMGSLVRHFGGPGDGTRAKIARNLISFASFVAAGEATRMADAAGLDLVALGEVVRHSDAVTGGAGAVMIRDTAAVMSDEDPLRAIFEHSVQLGHKDLALAVELGAELGTDTAVAQHALANLGRAMGLE